MNYYATARTNYFHVTDEAKFKQLMAGLSAEGGCHSVKDDNDPTMYAILFDGSASFYRPASLVPEFMETIEGKTVYDDKQTPIPIDEIDSHNCLYDEEGECIFDRWADDDEFDFFLEEIVKIIPENECFVYMESGYEGHRYVVGYAVVATKNGTKHMNLSSFVDNAVKELLGPDAKTKYEY